MDIDGSRITPEGLSVAEQDFWERHSGINATHQDVAKARDSDTAARALMVASAWTAEQVAERLNVPVSTVLLDTRVGSKMQAVERGCIPHS